MALAGLAAVEPEREEGEAEREQQAEQGGEIAGELEFGRQCFVRWVGLDGAFAGDPLLVEELEEQESDEGDK
jgi:hypothetical protein